MTFPTGEYDKRLRRTIELLQRLLERRVLFWVSHLQRRLFGRIRALPCLALPCQPNPLPVGNDERLILKIDLFAAASSASVFQSMPLQSRLNVEVKGQGVSWESV